MGFNSGFKGLIQSVGNIQAWLFTVRKKIPGTLHDDLVHFWLLLLQA